MLHSQASLLIPLPSLLAFLLETFSEHLCIWDQRAERQGLFSALKKLQTGWDDIKDKIQTNRCMWCLGILGGASTYVYSAVEGGRARPTEEAEPEQ